MQEPNNEQAMLREYLLGELDEEQQEQVETRLLGDEDFAERLYVTQNNLIDDFVFGVLSEHEAQRFETNFTLTDDRRKKILISQALSSYVGRDITYTPTPDEHSHVPSARWRNTLQFLAGHKPWAVISLAVALLLILVGPRVAKLLRESDRLAALQTQRARIERQVAELNRQPLDTFTEERNILKLVLQPAMLREGGEMKTAVITKEVAVLSVELALRPPRRERYNALVRTAEGTEFFAASDLVPNVDGTLVLLNTPAEIIHTGDYQLELSGIAPDGRSEVVGRYQFRVIRKSSQI